MKITRLSSLPSLCPLLCAAGLLASSRATLYAQTIDTWNGGTGNWSDGSFWSAGVPNSAGASVFVDGGKAVNSTVTVDGSYTVGALNISSGDAVNVNNGQTFVITDSGGFSGAGTLTNNGTFTLGNSSGGSTMFFNGTTTLAGTGTFTLVNNDVVLSSGGTGTLTIGSGQTVQGATGTGGGVGFGSGQLGIINQGTFNANVSGQTLLISPNSSGLTNNGTLEASNGGTLQLAGNFTNNGAGAAQAQGGGVLMLSGGNFAGGTFTALADSQVTISNGANVNSATLATVGTGVVVLTGGGTSTLTNVTNNGTLNALDNTANFFTGTLTNNGTINLASTGNQSDLRFIGATTLAGTGTVNLSGANAYITAQNNNGDRLTIGSGQTIAGTGNLGMGASTFTNQGTINANVSGSTLTIQPGGGNGNDFTNAGSGAAQAQGGGVLALSGGTFAGGTFTALAGSQVSLNGATVSGATLATVGTGVVVTGGNSTLTNVTNNGTLNSPDNTVTFFTGTLTNNGTINLASTGNQSDLRFIGATTLAGTGTVNLSGANAYITALNGGGDRLTIGAGQTIAGTGNLGMGASTFTNNGTINANAYPGTLTIQPGGGNGNSFTNNASGVLEAANGGTLVLSGANGGTFTNTGTIEAVAQGTVNVAAGTLTNYTGTTLTGGTYIVLGPGQGASTLSLGGGSITTNAASVVFSGSVSFFTEINALTTNQGTFAVANGRAFTTAGALSNSGTLVAAGGSTLTVNGNLTQSSTGMLTGNGGFTASMLSIAGKIAPGGSISQTNGAFTGGAGTLTLTGTTLLGSSTDLTFELGAVGTNTSDHLNVTGALTLDGRLDVSALTGFGVGRYDLIDYTGVLTNNVLDLGTLPAGYNYTIDNSMAGQVDLVVSVPESATWLGGLGLLGTAGLTLRRRLRARLA